MSDSGTSNDEVSDSDVSADEEPADEADEDDDTSPSSPPYMHKTCIGMSRAGVTGRHPIIANALVENGFNYSSNSVPSNFMFYFDDDWIDFSDSWSQWLGASFFIEPIVTTKIWGFTSQVDFERLFIYWVDEGCLHSIAWTDIYGTAVTPADPYSCGCWTGGQVIQDMNRRSSTRIVRDIPVTLISTYQLADFDEDPEDYDGD